MKKTITSLMVACLGTATIAQTTIYVDVDATGNNNGSSWTDAYVDLQDAIDNATSGDNIWIAEGTYYPTKDESGNASPSFESEKQFTWIGKELEIYGGFNGTETMLSERDWETHSVILSGDVGTVGNHNDNANRVMKMQTLSTSLLDGVSIVEGKGVGLGYGAFSINNCPGITLQNCIVSNNTNSGKGGSSISGSKVYFIDSEFHHNTSSEGGTSYVGNATIIAVGCVFHHNTSTAHSGNITFNGSRNGEPDVFINCLFHHNDAGNIAGGGLFFYSVTPGAAIINCTFASNDAPNGGAIGSNGVGLEIYNSIFFGGTSATQLYETNGNASIIGVQNSLVEGGYATGTNVLTSSPEFMDSTNYDFTVLSSSPVIDMGDTTGLSMYIPSTDLAGSNRYNGNIDMGCYESSTSAVSVEEMDASMIKVYPNPFNDIVRLSTPSTVQVFNLQGQLVYRSSTTSTTVDLTHLNTGVYLLLAQSKEGVVSTKISKN